MKLENYILTRSEDQSKLLDLILELANLYVESEFTDEIHVYRILNESSRYVIVFPNHPDFERFKYFVNYLHFPESHGFGTEIKGYWTINEGDDLPERFLGSRVMLFISKNDTEYDNVFCVFDSEPTNVKLGFASGEEFVELKHDEDTFFEKDISEDNLEFVTAINPDKELVEKRNNPKRKGIGCLALVPIFLAIAILGMRYVL